MRRIMKIGGGVLAGAVIAGSAWAQLSTVNGPVSQQSAGTLAERRTVKAGWTELISVPLNCIESPAVSADAAIQMQGASGPMRVRAVALPFAEGEQFDPVTFEPGRVVFRNPGAGATSTSFHFVGSTPPSAEVAFVSLQVRAVGAESAVIGKASLRVLWDATTPTCS